MPTRELLSPSQRAQFTEIPPDMGERDMARYYMLTDDDLKVINRHRGPHKRGVHDSQKNVRYREFLGKAAL